MNVGDIVRPNSQIVVRLDSVPTSMPLNVIGPELVGIVADIQPEYTEVHWQIVPGFIIPIKVRQQDISLVSVTQQVSSSDIHISKLGFISKES